MFALLFADRGDCRFRKMLKTTPTLAIGGVDTAENGPFKVWGYGVWTPPSPNGSTGARSSAQERHSEICSQVDAETQGPRGIVELLPSFREDDADEQEN